MRILGNFKTVGFYLNSYLDETEHINDTKRIKELNEFQIKHATKETEIYNKLLSHEKQMAEVRTKQYLIGMVGGLFFALLITAMAILLYRSKRRQQSIIQFRDSIFSIISHDLRPPLTAFQGLTKQATFLMRKGQYGRLQLLSIYMDESITSLLLLINNLLEWSLLQSPGW